MEFPKLEIEADSSLDEEYFEKQTGDTISRKPHGNLACCIWLSSVALVIFGLVINYLLPILGFAPAPAYPFKLGIEIIMQLALLFTSILFASSRIRTETILSQTVDEHLIVSFGSKVIGVCCLSIENARPSILVGSQGEPKYNQNMLLAMRAGMKENVTFTFEAGVHENEPYMRLFAAVDGNMEDVRDILRREATRVEAIMLASLEDVELKQLKGGELETAIYRIVPNLSGLEKSNGICSILSMKGSPATSPALDSSQIGKFLSTLLRKGCSSSLLCTFSSAKPSRKKKKLERKWKAIQSEEKRRETSLRNAADKDSILSEYKSILGESTWFNVSSSVIVVGDEQQDDNEAIQGLIMSIWGGNEDFRLEEKPINQKLSLRLLTRRHLFNQREHVSRLAAYVNMPVQKLPLITVDASPSFSIPSSEEIQNELEIGWTVYKNRKLQRVGLKPQWLREHVAVLGATGTGKTTLVKKLMSELSNKTSVPWWIFDIKGSEYLELAGHGNQQVIVLRPGLDPSLCLDLMNPEIETNDKEAHTTFAILNELIREKGSASELSPAMEKLLREAISELAEPDKIKSVQALVEIIQTKAEDNHVGRMTSDALLNRLEILTRDPLGSLLRGGKDALSISSLMGERVIFDLRYIARAGGMDAARVLYNLIAKRIFNAAMRRGINPYLCHVVVLEEASNLVPESYSRVSAADISTGESMVMLQRATGQGVIVVATRPNVSSNILANTGTKITFRLPYDSVIGGRLMALDEGQEKYLRNLKVGRALASFLTTDTFELATEPFQNAKCAQDPNEINTSLMEVEKSSSNKNGAENIGTGKRTETFDRIGVLSSRVIAHLAAKQYTDLEGLQKVLLEGNVVLDASDVSEIIRELVSLSTIERESLAFVPGGFIFTLPNKGVKAVRTIISNFILNRLESETAPVIQDIEGNWTSIILQESAILVIPEHLKASSLRIVLARIRKQMASLGNDIIKLYVVVRGSVAAAKLREIMDDSEQYRSVSIVSAFPNSLEKVIVDIRKQTCLQQTPDELNGGLESEGRRIQDSKTILLHHPESERECSSVEMRIWLGLIQEFLERMDGKTEWKDMADFIETTALQSSKTRSIPLSVDSGRHALSELLADEMIVAVRVGVHEDIGLTEGLWLVNTTTIKSIRNEVIEFLERELSKTGNEVIKGHGYYDLCVGDNSYFIFPTQQQLGTVQRLHTDIVCRICNSIKAVCLLPAAEYLDETLSVPENLCLVTLDDGLEALLFG